MEVVLLRPARGLVAFARQDLEYIEIVPEYGLHFFLYISIRSIHKSFLHL